MKIIEPNRNSINVVRISFINIDLAFLLQKDNPLFSGRRFLRSAAKASLGFPFPAIDRIGFFSYQGYK